ncbi:MAG: three-Cys-motif partner protein TcmP [Candidatus Omnitrophota bacterium]|nr:three-Cys-motif partner protein TcmP [Candidatus Omnitrophota bacterium]
MIRNCKKDESCKDKEGNCLSIGSDGLVVQCVGPWVEDKYYFLERYLNASREVRRKYAERGNAVFVDLFAGPGKCIIKDDKREIDGGASRALRRDEAQFNESFLFDISKANVIALEKRLSSIANCSIKQGDSNLSICELVKKLSGHRFKRYHFIFIDPFGPEALKFSTLIELTKLSRLDMLIHFPIMAIRRNLKMWVKKDNTILDEFLGTKEWRDKISSLSEDKICSALINVYKDALSTIGCVFIFDLKPVAIKNTKNAPLYDLILVSKNPLAQKIWNTVVNKDPDGQKHFNY